MTTTDARNDTFMIESTHNDGLVHIMKSYGKFIPALPGSRNICPVYCFPCAAHLVHGGLLFNGCPVRTVGVKSSTGSAEQCGKCGCVLGGE